MNLHFNPHALQELEEATMYYNEISFALAGSFVQEFAKVVSLIKRFPEACSTITPSTRRCSFKRFPYGVVYRLREGIVEIVAVMHLSRKPNYWDNR